MIYGPSNCAECQFGKRYGYVGDHYCAVLEEFFTNNVEPPYKERPDECPYNNVCFAITCDAVAKAVETSNLAYEEAKHQEDAARGRAKDRSLTLRQIRSACESAETMIRDFEAKHAAMRELKAMQAKMMKAIKEAHRHDV